MVSALNFHVKSASLIVLSSFLSGPFRPVFLHLSVSPDKHTDMHSPTKFWRVQIACADKFATTVRYDIRISNSILLCTARSQARPDSWRRRHSAPHSCARQIQGTPSRTALKFSELLFLSSICVLFWFHFSLRCGCCSIAALAVLLLLPKIGVGAGTVVTGPDLIGQTQLKYFVCTAYTCSGNAYYPPRQTHHCRGRTFTWPRL